MDLRCTWSWLPPAAHWKQGHGDNNALHEHASDGASSEAGVRVLLNSATPHAELKQTTDTIILQAAKHVVNETS